MAQWLKQFTQLAAITLIAVLSSTSAGSAIESQDRKAKLLADIAFQYAELGESQRSLEVLDQALRSTKAMTYRCFQANSLAKVAGGYLLVGHSTQGNQLLTEAIQTAQVQEATRCNGSGTSPTESLLNRAREYANAGHLELALELSQGLAEPITLAELAGHLAEAGQPERATEILNQAIELAQGINDQQYKSLMLVVMAERLWLAGHTEKVSLVLERALESLNVSNPAQSSADSLQIPSTLRVARGFAAIGANRQALEVLNQVVPKIQTLSSRRFPLEQFFYRIDAALQYDELEQKSQSVAILAEALAIAQGIPKDERSSREDALGIVAKGYAKLGDFKQAQQIARSIQAVAKRSSAFQQIAIAYAEAGNIDAAVKLEQSIGRSEQALIRIVRRYLRNKQPDQAWNFVQTHQVKGILSEVAVGYVEAGQPEQALQLLKNQQMEWLLPTIVRGFAQQGKLNSALQVTQSIKDKNYKVQALIAIAQSYTKKDSEREKAVEVLEQALQVTQSH